MHDSHGRLLAKIYTHLCDGNGRLSADWVGGHLKRIDVTDGDIDTLATRLAHIRTWTYIAHKGSWLDDSRGWQDRTRAIEDRLRSEEHTSELQSLIRTSYAVFCLKKKNYQPHNIIHS